MNFVFEMLSADGGVTLICAEERVKLWRLAEELLWNVGWGS